MIFMIFYDLYVFCMMLYDFIRFLCDFISFSYDLILFFILFLEVGPQFPNDPFILTINIFPEIRTFDRKFRLPPNFSGVLFF